MKGVCQTCGATAPLEWFQTTAQDRQCMAIIAELPRPVSAIVLQYVALFRPASGRSITPAKAQRLLAELKELIDRKYVQVPGKVARPCPPAIWAQAIEQMLDRRDRLQLPLANHNYLRQVAWPLADAADALGEKQRNQEAQKSTRPEASAELPVPAGSIAEKLDKMYPTTRGKKDAAKND